MQNGNIESFNGKHRDEPPTLRAFAALNEYFREDYISA